jgi:signal transduction histidine kinase
MLHIPASATDEERKRQLLNSLLALMSVVGVLIALGTFIIQMSISVEDPRTLILLYSGSGLGILGSLVLYLVNRSRPLMARWTFVIFLFILVATSEQLGVGTGGRSVIAYVVPCIVASVLLHFCMSCAFAGLSAVFISVSAVLSDRPLPIASIILLFLVAVMSALLTHAWEDTLRQWRALNRNLTLLNQASQAFSSTLDLDRVLVTVLDEVRHLLGLVACSIWLIDEATGDLVCQEATGSESDKVRGWRLEPGEGLAGWVAQHGRSSVVQDAQYDNRHFEGVDRRTGLETRSIVTVPLRLREDVIGVLQMLDATVGRFAPADLELLESLAMTAAIAIENARLYAEEQQRAEALVQALKKQKELDHLKDQFIQNVSHELRTPLALVRGHVELLESGQLGEFQDEQQHSIDVIARRARMLDQIVEMLTTFQTIEGQTLHYESIDLGNLVETHMKGFDLAAAEEIHLLVDVAPDLPRISGDVDCMRRLLDNLVGNALKFTPAGGKVVVQVGQGEGCVVLEVIDTGIGIPEEELDRIFERFYQVDGSTTRRYGGTGLGLALVKEIVEAHNGTVIVESQVGQGSTFRVMLPAA